VSVAPPTTAPLRAHLSIADRRLDYVWLAFAVLCLGVMVVADDWQAVPMHLIWISLSLVFGLRLWSRRGTVTAVGFVVLSTTAVMLILGQWHHEPAELVDVPLMTAVFGAMVWHARRRQRAMEDLAAAHERERAFLRDASHSLRTPLTVAFGHAEIVRDAQPEGSSSHADLSIVLDELRRLSRTSERLLTLAASDHAAFLRPAPFDPAALLHDVARRWSVATGRHVEAVAEPGSEIVADAERVREALDALVENALRASAHSDEVTLRLRHHRDSVAVDVCDRGLGIAPEDLARLFEPFARPAGAGGRGTGLGLAIVRAIAEAHGGGVDVNSVPGQGSVFTLRLGQSRSVAAASPAPAVPRLVPQQT
jgi:signal transduction histidine kinase